MENIAESSREAAESKILTKRIADKTGRDNDWERLSRLLLTKAAELHLALLEQTSYEYDKVLYYNQLGFVKYSQRDYEKTIEYYEKALENGRKTLHANHPDLANNISRNRIDELLRTLHFNNNTLNAEKSDKIQPLLDIFNERSKALVHQEEYIAIDEQMVG
ncbi:unnamed protein product, partial [Rotaria sordida]